MRVWFPGRMMVSWQVPSLLYVRALSWQKISHGCQHRDIVKKRSLSFSPRWNSRNGREGRNRSKKWKWLLWWVMGASECAVRAIQWATVHYSEEKKLPLRRSSNIYSALHAHSSGAFAETLGCTGMRAAWSIVFSFVVDCDLRHGFICKSYFFR